MAAGVLVVMELGTEWPGWLRECSGAMFDLRVAVQNEGEGVEAFAERVTDQVESLLSHGVPLGFAIIACNERADDRATAARRRMGRALSSVLARIGGGRVLLTTSRRSGLRVRSTLCTVAADLTDEWQRARVSSSVRFGPGVTREVEVAQGPTPRPARRPAKARSRRVA